MRGHGSVPAARLRPNPNIPIARCGYYVTNQKIQAVGRSLAMTRLSSLHDRNKHSHFYQQAYGARACGEGLDSPPLLSLHQAAPNPDESREFQGNHQAFCIGMYTCPAY